MLLFEQEETNLLNDDLQSHAGHNCGLNPDRIGMEDQQRSSLSQLLTTRVILKTIFFGELVNKNNSPSVCIRQALKRVELARSI